MTPTDSLTPGFIAAHSHRLEDLTEVAVNLMARYPLAPLQEDVLLVQSNGIAQWLKMQLASTTGIATMLDVTLPARFVWRAYRAVLGDDIPRYSPYDKDRLRWRLLRLLPGLMANDPLFSALKHYVANDGDQRKSFQLADKLADLLDQYQVYRAEWLDAWAQGQDVILHRAQAHPIEPEQRWQPALWRALVNDIGAEQICSNRAALHQRFIEQASALQVRPAGLPPRVVVFGISSLPRQTLEVLHALKGVCQVALCVHNPSQYHWADIIDGREFFQQQSKRRQQHKAVDLQQVASDELHLHAHPLLASWGKQGRDYIRLLDEFDETAAMAPQFTDLRFDLFDEQPPENLLQQLQSDVLHLRPVHETQQQWPDEVPPHDRSICFHRCHSPQREVEVLHDQLLAAFAADSSLQPRDIMVMVPDIDTYAPHIEAVFGRYQRPDKRAIPYTLADQGQRHREPLLIALDAILAAPEARFSHSEVFDLLHVPAVQQRFGLKQTDVELLQQWAADAGARWGLHAWHRQSLGLTVAFEQASWVFALKRMLYGYAAGGPQTEDGAWQDLEPYSEVAGMQAKAVGGLAEFIRVVEEYWQALSRNRTAQDWQLLLSQLLDDLFSPSDDSERLLLNRLRDTLDTWLDSVEEANFTDELRYNIVQEVWLGALDQGSLNQRFMAGAVNFATLMPMRAIPFKRVCLLGMNDGDYPRSMTASDFDLMAGHYQPGDRSRREDDRYLFLEALLSAREQFYVSWVGMSAQDNTALPPSVLVGQLQDHLNQGWRPACYADDSAMPNKGPNEEPNERAKKAPRNLSEQLTLEHRLQPFSRAYFTSEKAQPTGYFTYAKEWAAVHQQPLAAMQTDTRSLALPPFVAESAFSLYDLETLLKQPAELFAKHRLGVRLQDLSSQSFDDESFSLDGLHEWKLKDEIVTSLLAQAPANDAQAAALVAQCFRRFRRRGELPLAYNNALIEEQLTERILPLEAHIRALRDSGFERQSPFAFEQQLGRYHVAGELNNLFAREGNPAHLLLLEVKVSTLQSGTGANKKVKAQHILSLWLRHLVAQVALGPKVEITSRLIGDGASVQFAPQPLAAAKQQLEHLGQWLEQALQQPLPSALPLALQWLASDAAGRDETELDEAQVAKGKTALVKQYEGTAFGYAERERLPYTARFYANAESLWQQRFVAVSEALYKPYFEALNSLVVDTLVTTESAAEGGKSKGKKKTDTNGEGA